MVMIRPKIVGLQKNLIKPLFKKPLTLNQGKKNTLKFIPLIYDSYLLRCQNIYRYHP